MSEKRLVVALFGVLVAVVIGFMAHRFVAALTVSVFLYYSTRGYYEALRRLRLLARARAVVVLVPLAAPLLLLISYTLLLLAVETQRFVDDYAIIDVAIDVGWFGELESIPALTVEGIFGAYQAGEPDVSIDFAAQNAPVITDLSPASSSPSSSSSW